MTKKEIKMIADEYLAHTEYDNEGDRNENFDNVEELSTYDLWKKYELTFNDCKEIDHLIYGATWNNSHVSFKALFLYFTENLDEKFIKKHTGDIEWAIYEYLSLNDFDDDAYELYKKFEKYIDRDDLIEMIREEGIEYSDEHFEEIFPKE